MNTIRAGIFVGGGSRRMGGRPKGLLVAPDGGTIVERWIGIFRRSGVEPVLVGALDAYARSDLLTLRDGGEAQGPLAGLLALLEHADTAIAVACDMPHVSERLVRRLLDAPPSAIVAPRRHGRWEPFFARYEAASVLPVARARSARGEMALQGLLDECGARELVIDAREHDELHDWDTPEDMARRVD